MKRILYLTFYFRPDLCAGSFRNSPLAEELAAQAEGKEIHLDVVTTSPNRYKSFREEYETTERHPNMTIERLEIPTHESGVSDQALSFASYFFQALRLTSGRNYDLVFASSSRFFTSYLGYRIAKRNEAPLYLDVRDFFSETLGDLTEKRLVRNIYMPVIRFMEKRVYEYASHINLISEGFRPFFRFCDSADFTTYSHGVDPVFTGQKFEKPHPNDSTKTILYAGNIGEGQGLHTVIPDAAEMLNQEYRFQIIGDGGAKKELEARLKERNINNVDLLKPVNRKKLLDWYKKADMTLIHLHDRPIFTKVLPSKIFELAATEKPILAGVKGEAASFLKQNVKGAYLFEPGDASGMVAQIRAIEKLHGENSRYDNSDFLKKFSRSQINREMAESILSYL
jgi:glycosyltransferase involved in cell wall biosynthesis